LHDIADVMLEAKNSYVDAVIEIAGDQQKIGELSNFFSYYMS